MLHEGFSRLQGALLSELRRDYGDRLRSVVVFGSVARGTPRFDSDLDVLIVAEPLPDGRMLRVAEFLPVEARLAPVLAELRASGIATALAPVFKTPAELLVGSPLLFDLVDDARVLLDTRGDFAAAIARLRAPMAELGSQRIWRGNAWHWVLKPDLKPGEVFEL
jgi:predicted nucleotidyltransferase